MAAAPPELDIAIMNRIHQAAEARKKARQPVLPVRLLCLGLLTYTIFSIILLLISYMLDQGHTFALETIPKLFAIDLKGATTLLVSLLAFWVLFLVNYWLKNYFNKNSPKA